MHVRGNDRKAIIIGIDGASARSVRQAMERGRMPNLKRLAESGVFAEALPVLPTHTPTNWTTIGTGAWPGTHGITGFAVHHRGEPLWKWHSGFDIREVEAEFLWETAERAGKKSILLKWAGPTFPVTVRNGIQVDGCFCVSCIHEISGPRMYSTEKEPDSTRIGLRRAPGWKNLPDSHSEPLETTLDLGSKELKVELYVLVVNSQGKGYDRVLICTEKRDAGKPIGALSPGKWTDWIRLRFEGKSSGVGTLRLKLLELAGDASKMRIYCSQIMPLTGWTYPEHIARELVDEVGPFLQRIGYVQQSRVYGAWADHETMMEELEYQHNWFARAAVYLMGNYDWDLLFLQSHAPDYIFDNLIKEAEPLTTSDRERSEEYLELIDRTYEIVDRAIGRIVEKADEDTLVVVVSDHGVIGFHSTRHVADVISEVLEREGLLFCRKKAVQPGTKPKFGKEEIDWSRTKAAFFDSIHIYINLKGREPEGIVEPEEYEELRNRIIEALRVYKDPRLRACPFSLILKSEDAKIVGLYGDRIGDIIVAVRPGGLYGQGHGHFLPTADYGISSIKAV
ncbi:MAG TPA: hypothetical protein EYP53_00840, partial [Candidatus Latescibacteria bacterium]|nr:hypothetical protein [Candidatus Latescibacterota bacterium]